MNECNYTLKHYAECLELAMEKGYTFITFDQLINKKPKEPFIILRHDVDQHMHPVHWMCTIEEKIGIPANYFFRVHAKYNMGFKRSLLILNDVIEGGHLIGLHYDPHFNTLAMDKLVLENLLRIKVDYATYHDIGRTTSTKGKTDIKFVDNNALEKYNLKYISDSSHHWREETFCQAIEQGHQRLYVLIHPMWWYLESSVENY